MEPGLLGVEHEFVVSGGSGVVDFRTLIHGLKLGEPNLDPADPNAYRLPSGAAVTCDAAEAEIALPPITLAPGFAAEAAHLAETERLALAGRLRHGMTLTGYSTHLSVSVPDDHGPAVCQRYARTFAAAMILLADRRDSPGLLIRPRPGRVELGVEYLASHQLLAASIFAVATVLACLARVIGVEQDPPSELDVRVEPAVERFGWYVDRAAFGTDLLADGRSALLRTVDGRMTAAGAYLDACWHVARPLVEPLASPTELAVVDEAIGGERPLPSERVVDDPVQPSKRLHSLGANYARALRPRRRSAFELAPVMLTWQLAVFLIVDLRRRRRVFAAVPRAEIASFLARVDAGRLDEEVERFVGGRAPHRRLERWTQIDGVALFDEIGPRIGLLQPEFDLDGNLAAEAAPHRGRSPRGAATRAWWLPRAPVRAALERALLCGAGVAPAILTRRSLEAGPDA